MKSPVNLIQSVVNHSHGFISPDGAHTNNIEGFWAYLKTQMCCQYGVLRSEIDAWLEEFSFQRRYLKNYEHQTVIRVYKDLFKSI
ncbi:hypothetical protein ENBRE01_2098 [Enteropsectra breve]|nr:hypothetical protein ENBRE01_2098 [Enteropsectra breve]